MRTSALEPSAGASSVQALAGRYLTFRLAEESYALPVLKVREIIKLTPITAVPHMPDYVKGVINLRGKVIPVVGLRSRFGLAETEANERTCIVVAQVELAGQSKTLMGLIVDGVEEVTHIAARDIEETPDFGARLDTTYLLGMAKVKDAVKALLDMDKVVAADTIQVLEADRPGDATNPNPAQER